MRRFLFVLLTICGCQHPQVFEGQQAFELDESPRAQQSSLGEVARKRLAEVIGADLSRESSLIKALLAIDRYAKVCADTVPAADAYRALLERVHQRLTDIRTGSQAFERPIESALVAFGAMKDLGFRYGLPTIQEVGGPGEISYALLHKVGSCESLTLIALSLLDSLGVEAWQVCLPQHTFLRVRTGTTVINLEATEFGRQLDDEFYAKSDMMGMDVCGTHYFKSLSKWEIPWHYMGVGRLPNLRNGMNTDLNLQIIDETRRLLGSSCYALDYCEAKVYSNKAVEKKGDEVRLKDETAAREAEKRLRGLFEKSNADEDVARFLWNIYCAREDKESQIDIVTQVHAKRAPSRENADLFILYYLTRISPEHPFKTKAEVLEALSFLDKWLSPSQKKEYEDILDVMRTKLESLPQSATEDRR